MAKPLRHTIQNLTLNSSNVSIAGVLLAKSDVRLFSKSATSSSRSAASRSNYRPDDSGGGDDTMGRGVITFTVRDTPRSFINCVIWGSASFVESYNLLFQVGDVVNIMRPMVSIRKTAEEFSPMCSSPYCLTISEGTNDIVAYRADADLELDVIKRLVNVPIKATSAALQLVDISTNGSSSTGCFVDLLIVVRTIKPIKTIRPKQGTGNGREERNLATVIVMDHSSMGVSLNIWNQAFVKR